ncbi:hypothetical protein A2971_04210 [Candidatus Gottesmanbacteria bacterium RIFCSPLOWO2_01_FULL_46_21]|uniref:N-acetyltransferase domain-containing protein n=1 Tax=Candidatus Gottesmanbacteria bacterium RIFCSPLOWO2_01_FULL_46_21 TaxID=1798393 RepID=A0A1F6B093_9BACT|nr:MAG: hypothetical protein A2971_04210 [Candidatus Gottesmanbacteria bacterium RIFCSPLOWO2_01_FULL_46_21]
MIIRPLQPNDLPWVQEILTKRWGSTQMVTKGILYEADKLPGYLAENEQEKVGLVIYREDQEHIEIIGLDSLVSGIGIGSNLLNTIIEYAANKKLWVSVITTNDNLDALRFYQRRGFGLVNLYPDAIRNSRRLKPSIPFIGAYGIPLRDELELQYIK